MPRRTGPEKGLQGIVDVVHVPDTACPFTHGTHTADPLAGLAGRGTPLGAELGMSLVLGRGWAGSAGEPAHRRGQSFVEKAASKAASGLSNRRDLMKPTASSAPRRRSMPASSHSTEIGPS